MMVEVLVAISIITVAMLAAMAVSQKAVYIARSTLHAEQATFILEEGAEALRIVRDNGWANISALAAETEYFPVFSGGTWTLSATPSTVDIFTRKVVLSSVKRDAASGDIAAVGADDPGTKLVTVSVSWQEGGTLLTKTLRFYIFDIFS